MDEEEGPTTDPEKTLIAKGHYFPGRRDVAFQTKIIRFYPPADAVPYAGRTTAEINLSKQAGGRKSTRGAWRVISKVGDVVREAGEPVLRTKLSLSERKHFHGLQAQKDALEPLLHVEPTTVPPPSSPGRALQPSTQRRSTQAQALLQSQYPPFSGSPEAVEPPTKVSGTTKRLLAKGTYLSLGVGTAVAEQEAQPLPPPPRRSKGGAIARRRVEPENVFTYGLPTKRTGLYVGCVSPETPRFDLKQYKAHLTAENGFVMPSARAGVSDAERPQRRAHGAPAAHVGWDMVPLPSERPTEPPRFMPAALRQRTAFELFAPEERGGFPEAAPVAVLPPPHEGIQRGMTHASVQSQRSQMEQTENPRQKTMKRPLPLARLQHEPSNIGIPVTSGRRQHALSQSNLSGGVPL